jgi:pilus assembly protein CpaB
MKTQSIIILWVSIALGFGCLICGGLVASYLTSQLIAQRNKRVMVLVAKHNYPNGTAITDPQQMFELQSILEMDAPPFVVTELEELRDRTLTHDIHEGEPVVHFHLERTQDALKSMLVDATDPGKRTIEVKTKARGGFIKPGSRVDVIFTKADGAAKPDTKILLQNILVRAVEREMLAEMRNMDFVPFIVTLDVTPEEALVLAPLKEKGTITLVLRPVGAREIDGGRGGGGQGNDRVR